MQNEQVFTRRIVPDPEPIIEPAGDADGAFEAEYHPKDAGFLAVPSDLPNVTHQEGAIVESRTSENHPGTRIDLR